MKCQNHLKEGRVRLQCTAKFYHSVLCLSLPFLKISLLIFLLSILDDCMLAAGAEGEGRGEGSTRGQTFKTLIISNLQTFKHFKTSKREVRGSVSLSYSALFHQGEDYLIWARWACDAALYSGQRTLNLFRPNVH